MNTHYIVTIALIVLALTILFIIRSCTVDRKLKKLEKEYDRPPLLLTHPGFKRDSLLLSYAVMAHQHRVEEWSSSRKESESTTPQASTKDITIAEILYGPDGLRMVALVSMMSPRSPRAKDYEKRKMYGRGEAVVGIRTETTSPWKIYPLELIYPYGYDSAAEAAIALRIEYFENVTGQSSIGIGESSLESSAPMYNIDDPRFWSSALWRKGVSVPSQTGCY